MTSLVFGCATVRILSFPRWYWVCEVIFSHMGKNSGNPGLGCKKPNLHFMDFMF